MTKTAYRSGEEAGLSSWIRQAQVGSPEALAHLLEFCRGYLLKVANEELPRDLQAKVGASDVVQDTLLEAQRDLHQFAGQRDEVLLGWLRRMLLNNIANVRRRYQQTEMRDAGREVSFDDGSAGLGLRQQVAARGGSPSSEAIGQEEAQLVDRALERLPAALREVILLRHREQLSFAEIGLKLERSPEAARKLWTRAVDRLQSELVD